MYAVDDVKRILEKYPWCKGEHGWQRHSSKQVHTPVAPLPSLLDKYLKERYESTITITVHLHGGGHGIKLPMTAGISLNQERRKENLSSSRIEVLSTNSWNVYKTTQPVEPLCIDFESPILSHKNP